MRRELPGGYELDDDRDRIDVAFVHAWISERSYWAPGRSLEQMRAAIDGSARVIGVYRGEEQVGFARVVSDNVVFAYLADVFLAEEHRGAGLGVELVREAVEPEPWTTMKWYLATADAHDLYRRFGFEPPNDRAMERARPG